MSRLTADSEIVQQGLTHGIAFLLKALTIIVGIFVLMFAYSLKMSLVSIGMMLPICLIGPVSAMFEIF